MLEKLVLALLAASTAMAEPTAEAEAKPEANAAGYGHPPPAPYCANGG
jgi:hypothetical protein